MSQAAIATTHLRNGIRIASICCLILLGTRLGAFQPPGQDTPLHQAVRDDAIDRLNSLLDAGADINAVGADNRTPLALALQLSRIAIAKDLLRRGATIRFTSDMASQPPDIFYISSNDDLAYAFGLRILQQSLLHFNQLSRSAAQADLDRFNSNSSLHFDDMIWTVNCDPCSEGPIQVNGNNQRVKFFPLHSERQDKTPQSGAETDFRFQQDVFAPWFTSIEWFARIGYRTINGDALFATPKTTLSLNQSLPNPTIHWKNSDFPQPSFGPFTFTIFGTLTIPACQFSFDASPTCFPGISISAYPTSSDAVRPEFGPSSAVTVTQNGVVSALNPGASSIADRSAGPITVEVGPATQQKFTIGVDLERMNGPDVSITSGDLSPHVRISTYAKIAILHQQLDQQMADPHPNAVNIKALNTAIHILSAKAIVENYNAHALDLLGNVSREVEQLNDSMLRIRDAVTAVSQLTPDQVDLLLTQINQILPGSTGDQQTALTQIRNELQRAKAAAAAANTQVRLLRDNFHTYVDDLVTEFQALILEAAQFMTVEQLRDAVHLSVSDVQTIGNKMRASEVSIPDSAFHGNGASLRGTFGLPNPQF